MTHIEQAIKEAVDKGGWNDECQKGRNAYDWTFLLDKDFWVALGKQEDGRTTTTRAAGNENGTPSLTILQKAARLTIFSPVYRDIPMYAGILELLRDFATPFATGLGAAGAVAVTWSLGRGQLRIARQQAASADLQAQIAQDRLRFDQFDKRYEVFDTVRKLIQTTVNNSMKPDFSADQVIPLYARLNEAPLFFSKATCQLIDAIRIDCQRLIVLNSPGALPPPPPPMPPARYVKPEKYALAEKLVATLNSLPENFVPELGLATSSAAR
jgi:hypothetical protein